MPYVLVHHNVETLLLGSYSSKKEAEHAYYKFITHQVNYKAWLKRVKTKYPQWIKKQKLDADIITKYQFGSLKSGRALMSQIRSQMKWEGYEFWVGTYGLGFTIVEVQFGEYFDPYDWDDWKSDAIVHLHRLNKRMIHKREYYHPDVVAISQKYNVLEGYDYVLEYTSSKSVIT